MIRAWTVDDDDVATQSRASQEAGVGKTKEKR
jgi:hypothetical protein